MQGVHLIKQNFSPQHIHTYVEADRNKFPKKTSHWKNENDYSVKHNQVTDRGDPENNLLKTDKGGLRKTAP